MKKILGLDLGTNSIGWALIEVDDFDCPVSIVAMGSRIIPLSSNDRDEFLKGNSISKNQNRTLARTQRKGYDRKQIRKKELKSLLEKLDIMPTDELMNLPKTDLWKLRSDATDVNKNISAEQFGRILYHLNQKRGYKSARSEANMDKKDTDYVAEVKGRYAHLKEQKLTVGNYIFNEIINAETNHLYFRKKDRVFPREAYIEEFETIMNVQKGKHSFLTNEVIDKFKKEIIFYQRPLKSQKGLVSICEFEGFEKEIIKNDKQKVVQVGAKVAPKSSPLNQLCKVWENVNNIVLKIKNPEGSKYKWGEFVPNQEQKKQIADYLFNNENLNFQKLIEIVGLKKDQVYVNKQILKGIQGHITLSEIKKHIDEKSPLLKFNIEMIPYEKQAYLVDRKTGEIIEEKDAFIIKDNVEQQPLYQLWHTIYSIKDSEECKKALIKKFDIDETVASNLAKIDFTKYAYANKSHKAIRKILPYLMQGFNYADACSLAGYNHSNSLTKHENKERILKDQLTLIPKNGLRQPVVEKILNQMINLVNAIIEKHGRPTELRVELARELKQSKDERNDAEKANKANETLNKEISKRLAELGLPTTKKFIQKYKFIFPVRDKKISEAQANCQCIYCGETFSLSEALSGDSFDVDHIVPKALLFDDSQLNKVLVHRKCNKDKTNTTAYDYMASKGDEALNAYIQRVDKWYKDNILSYGKMLRLKVSHKEYVERKKQNKQTESDKKLWENFIDRNLRETAYIARKARLLLQEICHEVHTTEGNVTAKLRELWGWDDVLMNLQMDKYRELGQTEWVQWTSDHGKNIHRKEQIKNWTKRDDHRHHAIDALVVACTQQGFIQRINTLNADDTKDEMRKEIELAKKIFGENFDEKILEESNEIVKGRKSRISELDLYLRSKRPNSFTTKYLMDAADKILVSFKAGKKVATISKFKAKGRNKDQGVITPRGGLHEQFVYGKIKVCDTDKPVKYLFGNSDLIIDAKIRQLVKERLSSCGNDSKKAIASLKKTPLFLDDDKKLPIESANCYKNEFVIKYKVQDLKKVDVQFIIDKAVKEKIQQRLDECDGNEKEAFKNIIWYNKEKQIPIRTVRCFTKLSSVEPLKKDENGKAIGFVKPGSNHHVAIYKNDKDEFIQHICTFWHAVERKKYGMPYIIKDTKKLWGEILSKELSQTFLDKLPADNLQIIQSLQQNEMFVLGMNKEDFDAAIRQNDYRLISKHLYLVWKISTNDYWFRHHLETKVSELDKIGGAKESKRYYRFNSIGAFINANPIKVKISNLGELKLL